MIYLIIIIFVIIAFIIKTIIDKSSAPLLIKAVKNNDLNLVSDFLYKGEDIETKDKTGQTSVFFANNEVMELLIKKGANINVKDSGGWTPLMTHAFNFEYEIVEMLLKNGAMVNEQEEFGQTALILLLVQSEAGWDMNTNDNINSDKIIETLIKYGADLKIKDNEGKMAIDYARRKEHIELLKNALNK